jgi:hypothetical protein
MICKECDLEFNPKHKRGGYVNVCSHCDEEDIEKTISVLRADGKTDYGIELVRNPTKEQVAYLKSINVAHDPRTQMRFTGKGRNTDK